MPLQNPLHIYATEREGSKVKMAAGKAVEKYIAGDLEEWRIFWGGTTIAISCCCVNVLIGDSAFGKTDSTEGVITLQQNNPKLAPASAAA